MSKFNNLPLLVKLLFIGVGTILILVGTLFFLYYKSARGQVIQSFVTKSRAICLISESVRNEMEEKWKLGLFSIDQMKKWAKDGEMEKVVSAVPVVSAWRASMRKAKQGGYTFRVPKFSPRNPKNEPDYGLSYKIEGPAIKKIKNEDLKEYFVIDERINSVRYFLPVKLSKVCLNCHGDPELSKTLWGRNDGKDPTGGKFENWKEGEIHGVFEVIQSLDKPLSELRGRLFQASIVVILGIGLTAFVFFFITRSITLPIIRGVKFARKMARGDLTENIEITNDDEVGKLGVAMNTMIEGLREIITGINQSVDQLKHSSSELTGASDIMSSEVGDTSEMAVSVSAAAEEMSSNMDSVAAAVEQTSVNVNMVATAAEEMSSTIGEIAKNSAKSKQITEEAVDKAENASLKVKDLGEAANDIGNVTVAIADISEQTNLLALNATIEAARAGEAGKGFNVVATEIKALAHQTSDATNEISSKIERMQQSTQDIVNEINIVSKVINDVNDIVTTIAVAVEEQSSVTNEIAENVAQASQGIGEVTENVSQSSIVSSEVAQNIASVSNSATAISGRSKVVKDHAGELSKLSEVLSGLLSKFKLK